MNPVDPDPPIGPRWSWRRPATSARNSWRTPAVGPDPSWSDPGGGPTVGWHVPTSLTDRTWQVPATTRTGKWRGTTGPVEFPDRVPAAPGQAATQTTWCAPTTHIPSSAADTRAKLVGPVRSRGCAVAQDIAHDIDQLTDTLRALRFQELARVLERHLSPPEHQAVITRATPVAPPDPPAPVPPPPQEPAGDVDDPQVRPALQRTARQAEEPAARLPSPPAHHAAPESDEPAERRPPPRRARSGAGVVRGTEHGDREGFLAEARRHLGGLRAPGVTADEPAGPAVPKLSYATLDAGDLVGSFRRAVERSGGVCHHVVGDLPDSLLDVLVAELDAWEIVVTGDPELHELSSRLANRGVEVTTATPERAVTAGMGVTCAVAGIAATGSLVFDSRRDRGRLAALLPPMHLCVLPVDRLVATPSDVLRALGDDPGPLSPSLMLVTGPSHTTNLERLLTVGTPGPTALHVIVQEPHPDL